jgi:hypothetical protein
LKLPRLDNILYFQDPSPPAQTRGCRIPAVSCQPLAFDFLH